MLTITENTSIAEIVSNNIKTANVFKQYGIDFCCGGGISIQKACEKKGLAYTDLETALRQVSEVRSRSENYAAWNLSFLIDHIVNIHHSYVSNTVEIVQQYANKVAKVHGHHYTELHEIKSLFHEVAKELLAHMQKEEQILFPYIKHLLSVQNGEIPYVAPHFDTVDNPIQMMEEEHENAGDIFKKIAGLTNNYTPPESACNTFRALYASLQEFEEDLHVHVHLENNILHPKAKKLEEQVLK